MRFGQGWTFLGCHCFDNRAHLFHLLGGSLSYSLFSCQAVLGGLAMDASWLHVESSGCEMDAFWQRQLSDGDDRLLNFKCVSFEVPSHDYP